MIRISTRGQYALLIMTDLAGTSPEKYIPLKYLSHKHNLSTKYLEQILIQLSKSGLVSGLRGNNGGYKLNKRPDQYTAGEILRALEGDLSPRGVSENNVVSDVGNNSFWTDFENTVNQYVDSVTLDILVEKNNQDAGYMYYI